MSYPIPDLTALAKKVMREKGLQPDFTADELDQLSKITAPASLTSKDVVDLRALLFCSIDNDDSLDLDQLTYAEDKEDGTTVIYIAIADVDALVTKNSPIDLHAQFNTTSIYTPTTIFPMLPEKLSTDLTSLKEGADRISVLIKITVDQSGLLSDSTIFKAIVHNYAKLAYSSTGAWLNGSKPIPDKVKNVSGLENALKKQHEIAQRLRRKRHELGSLTLYSPDIEVKVLPNQAIHLQLPEDNFANQLIEEFMIAANTATADHFKNEQITSLRRVVREPKYWDQIVEVAHSFGESLPSAPNSKALDAFLIKRKETDPISFPDLSLTIIKLLGRGEYIVEKVGDKEIGHFGLALPDYTHSTAPNRRFPDLISQRQSKAVIEKGPNPYSEDELQQLAAHCTAQEDAANKVERRLNKSASALLLSTKIGMSFKGIITGASDKGTWIRIFDPPVEGKIIRSTKGLKVGDKISVRLQSVDVEQGFIDFVTTP